MDQARTIVRQRGFLAVVVVAIVSVGLSGVVSASPVGLLVVGWDGVSGGLPFEFVPAAQLPMLGWMKEHGVVAERGVLPIVPSNTSPSWPSILTGAHSGTHAITNNAYHNVTDPIMLGSYGEARQLRAETLPFVAESHGFVTATLGGVWLSWPPEDSGLVGPVMGWGNYYSKPIVLSNYEIEGAVLEPYLFLDYERIALTPMDDTDVALTSFSPARGFTLEILAYSGDAFTWDFFATDTLDDGITNYDTFVVVPRVDGASGTPVAVLREGDWAALPALIEGKRVGLHVKLLDFSGGLDRVRLYATAIRGPQAAPAWLEDELSQYVSIPIGPSRDAIIGGFVDEPTFAEEVIRGINWMAEAYTYVIARTSPDVVFAYFTETDEWLHRMMGYLDPKAPFYDTTEIDIRRALFADVFTAVDEASYRVWQAMGGPAAVPAVVVSDHGFASTWKIANVNERLAQLGLYDSANPAAGQAVAYSAGATTQVYINLEGRQPGGIVKVEDYDAVKDALVQGLQDWRDDDGTAILDRVLTQEQAQTIVVHGREFNFAHHETSGDVVAFANHPYQFDAAAPGLLVTPGIPYFTGQHGYIADAVPAQHGNMRPTFAAGGKGIRPGAYISDTAALIDVAPTLAALLGLPAPAQSEGMALDVLFTETVE